MIVLDTCVLRGCGLDSSSAELLRTIRESGVEGVAVPWVVMEELVGQHAVKYMKQHQAAAQSIGALKNATPWLLSLDLEACDPEAVRAHWRKKYGEAVDTIPTSENALREAAVREANGLAPARIDAGGSRSVKTGYRDAAVWMSAVEYARDHPDETVYFVSSNTKDFGDGTVYDYPMDQDIHGIEDRLVHLTALDQIVSRFTEATTVSEDHVREILEAPSTCRVAGEAAATLLRRDDTCEGFAASTFMSEEGPEPVDIWGQSWINGPVAHLVSARNVQAYKIGEHQWCTATASWLLAGLASVVAPLGGGAIGFTACTWETRVLLKPQENAQLVVLRSSPPKALARSDVDTFLAQNPSHPPFQPTIFGSMAMQQALRHLTAVQTNQEKASALEELIGRLIGQAASATDRPV